MVKVKIHTFQKIKDIVGGRNLEISLPEGSNLNDLFGLMATTWGDQLSSLLFMPDSRNPLPYIRILVNGQDIAFLDGLETALGNGDEVIIIPPVAGG